MVVQLIHQLGALKVFGQGAGGRQPADSCADNDRSLTQFVRMIAAP
jgi:hypothetical protein